MTSRPAPGSVLHHCPSCGQPWPLSDHYDDRIPCPPDTCLAAAIRAADPDPRLAGIDPRNLVYSGDGPTGDAIAAAGAAGDWMLDFQHAAVLTVVALATATSRTTAAPPPPGTAPTWSTDSASSSDKPSATPAPPAPSCAP